MPIEVSETIVTSSTTAAKIDLPETTSRETKETIGEYLIEQILLDVAKRRSPVYGDAFQPLSDPYKEKKQDDGLSGVPNLEFSGEMLDQLDFKVTEDGIIIGVFGDAAPRADGHNNLSGDSQIPTRRFIPDVGESFRSGIEKEVDAILSDAAGDDITEEQFEEAVEGVETSSELYDRLGAILNLTSRAEIRATVFRSPMLFNLIGLYDLDDLL
jgi:hypothetical protein